MNKIFSSSLIAVCCSMVGATTVEPGLSQGASKASETQGEISAQDSAAVQKHLGSWKNAVPDFSGWIEVDPLTGKPIPADLPPQMMNLNSPPLRHLADG